ncbi:MAG: DeoR family transcriptional regulator [Burkholderiales bacterium]|nr:DeoR family transcriptional regulator [Anaerolineae bacterium]
MFLGKRETDIVSVINRDGTGSVRDLAERFGVTEVTIRRDLKKLEQLSLLKRTHGGAVSIGSGFDWAAFLPTTNGDSEETVADALILPPVPDRVAHTLRERALRKRIPLIAESCPQENGLYLGHDNYEVGHALGEWTGRYFKQHGGTSAHLLDITLQSLPNTRERSRGFIDGLSANVSSVKVFTVDGNGLYDHSYGVARDALHLHPEINIIFGINDDSVLAGIQAHADLDNDPADLIAVVTGGEGKTLLDVLAQDSPLKACAALFPEIVGRLAIDAIVHLWEGGAVPDAIITPYRIMTHDTLKSYYTRKGRDWELIPERFAELVDPMWQRPVHEIKNRTISFAILYRTHEWYQNIVKAVHNRAAEYGIEVRVNDWKDDFSDEIRELRRLIGKLAASYVDDGDTIILDAGVTTEYMAPFLRDCPNIAVVTNSVNLLQRLQSYPNVDLIVTGGKFDGTTRSLLGRGAQLLLRDIRADKAFIVADGLSAEFGVSSATEMKAEVQRAMITAAREVIVLADHTILDVEADFHMTGLDAVDTLITDMGITASQRLDLSHRGIRVLIAGEVSNLQ